LLVAVVAVAAAVATAHKVSEEVTEMKRCGRRDVEPTETKKKKKMMMTCQAAVDAIRRCGEGEHLLTATAGCNYQYYRN
jgi:hypothetical protein